MSENEYQVQIQEAKEEKTFPEQVIIIPIMNSPIFPGMIAPIILSQEKYTPELDNNIAKTGYLALNLVKFNNLKADDEEELYDDEEEIEANIDPDDIYKVGVLCKVVKKLKLPDGSVNILVHGMKRYRTTSIEGKNDLLLLMLKSLKTSSKQMKN